MNAFDIKEDEGLFVCTSKYFEGCVGKASTIALAIHEMERQILYVKDNKKTVWNNGLLKQIKEIKARGEVPLQVYMGNKRR